MEKTDKKKIAAILLAVVLAIAMCGCGTTSSAQDNKTVLLEMRVGEEAYIKADDEAAWKSATDVVTVETTGRGYVRVYAVTDGASIVTNGTKKYMISVSSPSLVGGFTVKENFLEIDLSEDEYATIEVEGRQPSDFTYTAANRDVVSVDENGEVRGRGKGVTYVTVTDKQSSAVKRVNVCVTGTLTASYAKTLQTGMLTASSHVQGVDCDRYGDYFYYSFTDRLIKQSKDGEIVGSVTGFDGHLGDVAYNKQDDKLYVSYIANSDTKKCYMIIFDPEKITKENMQPDAVATCVYVGAPIVALSTANGYNLSDEWRALGGKYGVTNAIDSCTFGPKFGGNDGKLYLTLGLCAPGQNATATVGSEQKYAKERTDNAYAVLVQFDVTGWNDYAKPVSEIDTASGPDSFDGTYFYHWGYHTDGIQNLCYDAFSNTLVMTSYDVVDKTKYPNYNFIMLDFGQATEATLVGNGEEKGLCLACKYGVTDTEKGTGIRGYNLYSAIGFIALRDGNYYVCRNDGDTGDKKNAQLRLYSWNSGVDPETNCPIEQVQN